MLNAVNENILTPFKNIQLNIMKGLYMSSVITADSRASCSSCGATSFTHEIFDTKLKLSISKCECGGYPDKIRIRRSLPIGTEGEAERVDIRYNKMGERITDIEEAKHIARSIDYDIKSGKFDPNEYRSRSVLKAYIFKNYIQDTYLSAQRKRLAKGELNQGGFRRKESSVKVLVKFFGDTDIRKLNRALIMDFYDQFEGSNRSRDLVIEELNFILNYAFDREVISKKPTTPKTKKAEVRDVENFLTDLEQEKILSKITDPLYRAMIECLIIYAMRPCEIRALTWGDLDFGGRVISISRHYSDGSTLTEGRKSNNKIHYLPMTEKFLDLIRSMPHSINKNELLFKGKHGGPVGANVLGRHWGNACKQAKIKHIELYEGTKHSRLSFLKRQGYSDDQLILLSGHTNVETLKRYAQITRLNKLERVKEMIQ